MSRGRHRRPQLVVSNTKYNNGYEKRRCAEKNLLGCGCSGGGLLAEEEDNGRAFITNSVALSFETGNILMAGWLADC